jgi:hypothetical protein
MSEQRLQKLLPNWFFVAWAEESLAHVVCILGACVWHCIVSVFVHLYLLAGLFQKLSQLYLDSYLSTN